MKPLSLLLSLIVLTSVSLTVGCKSGDDTGVTDTGIAIIDDDGDGVAVDLDCDDLDETLGAVAEDGDCDGTLTAADCDDSDSASTIVSEDGDCDGALTADDCDDGDSASTIVSEDGDCDGWLTADDCDDGDAGLGAVAEDGDCDGWLTADDCDDGDSTSTIVSEDGDCDGWLTADDCDDGDNSSTIVSEDGDCDGTLTADDCDDGDSASTIVSEDGDCDGTLTAADCDDGDNSSTIVSEDGDCDGWVTADDCDDADATLELDDLDGDGYSTCDGDCDDNDASLELDDVDLDGYSTCDGDCDDTDATALLCPITHPGGGDMLFIPAGSFDMGCTAAQQSTGYCDSYESPVHSVTFTHDFYMGETEVTQVEYESVMGTNPSLWQNCGPTCPVDNITWHEVAEYANALSVLDGLTECFTCASGSCTTPNSPYICDGYRLPTEAEWEYAARAGTDYLYAGSDIADDVAWYSSNASSKSQTVAQKDPNDWGLYDMSGNVWEWTWDWYDSGYYSSSPLSDPEGPTTGSYRVIRGGSFGYSTNYLRISDRVTDSPSDSSSKLGFRLSRTLSP